MGAGAPLKPDSKNSKKAFIVNTPKTEMFDELHELESRAKGKMESDGIHSNSRYATLKYVLNRYLNSI